MDRLVKDYFCSFVFSSKKIILHCEYTQGRADNNWACFYKIIKMLQNLKLSQNTILKGGFFSESAIRFSDLQISKKYYSKKLS